MGGGREGEREREGGREGGREREREITCTCVTYSLNYISKFELTL